MTTHGPGTGKYSDGRLERTLALLGVGLLAAGCFIVLRPFVSALLWSVVLCFSTWPVYERVLKAVRGRRTLAALLMTLGLVVVLLVPFFVVGVTLADNVKQFTTATKSWIESGPPDPPNWLVDVPVLGPKVFEYWQGVAHDSAKLFDGLKRFIEPAGAWLLKLGLMLGRGLLQIGLSLIVAFFLFRDGHQAAEWVKLSVERVGGALGRHLLDVAGRTVRGVVYGILGTALVQAITAGIGFSIAGVPGAGLLTLLTFFLAILPMGPPLVWFPAALWLFHQGWPGWGIFMLVWGMGVSSIDNLVRPWLISQGSNLPFILVFLGAIGGALAFGFIGVFLGPTLLGMGYSLAKEWLLAKRGELVEPPR
ncbi:MAG: AI-2E family transporter [Verrucomicrobiae bacterium]|nr:AI-2E family transporter [Verrucomicrobiae bacterium]MCX7722840.1 AI-2E family transporter [Verrucomicrobiae bacterium]MDW7980078.1 AI-2E family transporter [Verrucomicrobiales bacterium]